MRIKPKNPKALKLRRILLGIAALSAVLVILLYESRDETPAESSVDISDVTSAAPEGAGFSGELDWQYPPGWVDYSDLPLKEELGDENVQGLSNWRYLLVNGLTRENYLQQKYYPDMEPVESGYSFQTRAADNLRAFLKDARAQGYVVSISRTWLSYDDQRVRFNGMASTLYDKGGISLADAEQQVIGQGFYPGADEHQTGLAVNFVDENGDAKFSTPVLQWMREHCHEYGFILRYPEGKEDVTGREPESGHFRFVGELAAEYIMRKGITLEEFKQAYTDKEEDIWDW